MYYKTEQLISFFSFGVGVEQEGKYSIAGTFSTAWTHEALQVSLAHECAQAPEQEGYPNSTK